MFGMMTTHLKVVEKQGFFFFFFFLCAEASQTEEGKKDQIVACVYIYGCLQYLIRFFYFFDQGLTYQLVICLSCVCVCL